MLALDSTLPDGRYLHWDELRYRQPPDGLNAPQWWAGIHQQRMREAQPVQAMQQTYDAPFRFVALANIQRQLHDFDRVNVGSAILSA
ncbi:MAG: hypothetical protein ABW352_16815, partial [Polyangiales bacterium]